MQERFFHSENIHRVERGLYIGDLVYGANDGIITTFAIISGATGAAISSGLIVILGLASLIADSVSMGLSNYLAINSKLDYQKKERQREEFEIEKFRDTEIKEVRDILVGWGLNEPGLSQLLFNITSDKKVWTDFMMKEELGIVEEKVSTPWLHGLVTSLAFIVAGFLPLIPYTFGIVVGGSQFLVSVTATAASLFIVGALRVLVTGENWFKSGLEMLLIGSLAAGAAYVVGGLVKDVFGIAI